MPVPGWTLQALFRHLAAPYTSAVVVSFDEWENRLLIAGNQLGSAREVSRDLRAMLRQIDSNQSSLITVRSL